jgi:hypothetical protein
MNELFFERSYQVRVGVQYALRLRSPSRDGYTSALSRGATALFVVDSVRGWAIFPEKDNAVLTLRELQEHWDELRVQIDSRHKKELWKEITNWSEVENSLSLSR